MNASAQALADHLDRPDDLGDPTSDEFVITTLDQATWAARRIKRLADQADEIVTAADAERARIDAWQQEAQRPMLDAIERLSDMLRFFHQTEINADPKRKTIKLPHGVTLKSTAQQPAWEVDPDAFCAWARVNAPAYVAHTITHAPRLTDMKAAAKAADVDVEIGTGGLLIAGVAAPGVSIVDRPRKFDVKIES